MSGGWGLNPPAIARPVNPPIYNFEIDSELFCDLVELCLSFNQFKVNGNFYRQIQGLFMGSSISPPLAMTYMEHFEKHIYEIQMPIEIKATVWDRYVDDCFLIYEHSDEDFNLFFNKLNNMDPYIKFTCEKSMPGEQCGFDRDVMEVLPFLDLAVLRHLNSGDNVLSNKLSIYRKPTHSGAYIHSLSAQPLSTKRCVIRSLFL